ncbi:MAG: glycosyltransferase family 39 protein [bacterium]|nr:glycosyltransferase family 39 protein [bacterium]
MNRLPSLIFVSILVLAVALRLLICALPTETLIVPALFDDSFIGLKMSQNMAEGKWITWDGHTRTNALTNPGFLLLMSPVYRLFPGRHDFALHVILGLSALADGLVIFLLYRFVAFLAGRRAGLLAVLLWAFNPYVISFNLSGSEHAFESLGFIACVSYYVMSVKAGGRRSPGRFALLGLMLGATAMFRVSLLFLFLFIAADVLLGALRAGRRESPAGAVGRLLLMTAGFTLVISPWLLYSFLNFGTIIPHNAALITYFNRNFYLLQNPGLANWLQANARFLLHAFNCWFEIIGLGHLAVTSPYPIPVIGPLDFTDLVMALRVALIFIGGAIAWSAARRLDRPGGATARLPLLGFAFAAVTFLTLYYGGVQWKLDKRYFIEAVMLFSIAAPVIAVVIVDAVWPARRARAAVLASLAALALLNCAAHGIRVREKGPESVGAFSVNHRSMLNAAMWINRNLPGDVVIGSFNPGIYGYYLRNPVVDLVGIANRDAWEAAQERRLLEYIWEKKVDYVIDFETCFDFFYSPYLTGGDYSYWNHIEEGPYFAFRTRTVTPMHLYIVRRPDGSWDGIPLDELKRRGEADPF